MKNILYKKHPYGPEMCEQLSTGMKGFFKTFSQENLTCIISASKRIIPEICFLTQKKFEKCIRGTTNDEGEEKCSRVPVVINKSGKMTSGSLIQLLNSVNVGIDILPCMMLPNKQIMSLDVSHYLSYQKHKGKKLEPHICAFSGMNVEHVNRRMELAGLSKYKVCVNGKLSVETVRNNGSVLANTPLHWIVVWHQCFSLKPFAEYSYGEIPFTDERNIELNELLQTIARACDVTLLGTVVRRHIQSVVVPSSKGDIGFHTDRDGISMICYLIANIEETVISNCRNIRRPYSEYSVTAFIILISKPWSKMFEMGNEVRNLDEFIRLIQMGHRVKLVIRQKDITVLEAAVVFIKRTGFVDGQFLSTNIRNKSDVEIWRYVSSKLSVTSNDNVYGTTDIYTRVKKRRLHATWFVDPYPWEFAFHVRDNGTVVSGSRELFIKIFQEHPMKVRVETTFEKYTVYESAARLKVDLLNQIIFAYITPHFHLEMDNIHKFRSPRYRSTKVYCVVSSSARRSCEEFPSMLKTDYKVEMKWFIQK